MHESEKKVASFNTKFVRKYQEFDPPSSLIFLQNLVKYCSEATAVSSRGIQYSIAVVNCRVATILSYVIWYPYFGNHEIVNIAALLIKGSRSFDIVSNMSEWTWLTPLTLCFLKFNSRQRGFLIIYYFLSSSLKALSRGDRWHRPGSKL